MQWLEAGKRLIWLPGETGLYRESPSFLRMHKTWGEGELIVTNLRLVFRLFVPIMKVQDWEVPLERIDSVHGDPHSPSWYRTPIGRRFRGRQQLWIGFDRPDNPTKGAFYGRVFYVLNSAEWTSWIDRARIAIRDPVLPASEIPGDSSPSSLMP
ncbi:MAG TPA: hypothetical protein VFF67_00885 [Thermoplasmata archaeon]|nr:hypothetical protein [Thermoplasmata archaeon]